MSPKLGLSASSVRQWNMPHPGAPALLLRDGDHEQLTRLFVRGELGPGLGSRSEHGLCCWPPRGLLNADIAARSRVSRPTGSTGGGPATPTPGWPGWSMRTGRDGPRIIAQRQIVAETLVPPEGLGVTHWSSRLLAARLMARPSQGRGVFLSMWMSAASGEPPAPPARTCLFSRANRMAGGEEGDDGACQACAHSACRRAFIGSPRRGCSRRRPAALDRRGCPPRRCASR